MIRDWQYAILGYFLCVGKWNFVSSMLLIEMLAISDDETCWFVKNIDNESDADFAVRFA